MMKKLFPAAALCLAVMLSGCSAQKTEEVHPPFFEVSDPETGGHAYLLGSMHAGSSNAVYPEEIFAALEESDTAACELDTVALSQDSVQLADAMQYLLCPDGTTAADLMGDEYENIRAYFIDKKIYSPAYEGYLPVMWSMVLSNKIASDCGYSSDNGTETVMLNYAKKLGKPIHEIESAAQQYAVNAAEPMPLQLYSLAQAINTGYEDQLEQMRTLYGAWSSFDGETLSALTDENIPDEYADDYREYYDSMYTGRQRVMADYVISQLKDGNSVFMFVGAMHFYAEPDIITCLEEAGYTVSEIHTDGSDDIAA